MPCEFVKWHVGIAEIDNVTNSSAAVVGLRLDVEFIATLAIKYAMIFRISSVFPICAALIITIFLTFISFSASMISRKYGVLFVRQRPGSADDSDERRRYSSAHCETVRSGGGARTEKIRVNSSSVACFMPVHFPFLYAA